MWDSGIVTSGQSVLVKYRGENLKGRTQYFWKVLAEDNYGDHAEGAGTFETAMMDLKEWKAKWVVSPFKMKKIQGGFGNQNPATLFRKVFRLKKGRMGIRLWTLWGVMCSCYTLIWFLNI